MQTVAKWKFHLSNFLRYRCLTGKCYDTRFSFCTEVNRIGVGWRSGIQLAACNHSLYRALGKETLGGCHKSPRRVRSPLAIRIQIDPSDPSSLVGNANLHTTRHHQWLPVEYINSRARSARQPIIAHEVSLNAAVIEQRVNYVGTTMRKYGRTRGQ